MTTWGRKGLRQRRNSLGCSASRLPASPGQQKGESNEIRRDEPPAAASRATKLDAKSVVFAGVFMDVLQGVKPEGWVWEREKGKGRRVTRKGLGNGKVGRTGCRVA